MGAWVADMSANLVAGLLTVLVAYLAGRRFWDRRVAGAVQTYVEEFDGTARRLHVRNGSSEMIFDPHVTFWAQEREPQSEPFRDADGRAITYLLPGQSWSDAEWNATDPLQPVVVSFKTGRNRAHVKGVAAYERASPWKLLVNLGAFLLLTLLFGGLSRLLVRTVAGIRRLRWWGPALLAVAAAAGTAYWLLLR
jgi:hypothetical protein